MYVAKKKFGKEYALSTNTDIYSYNILTEITTNLTEGMMGYDMKPAYSSTGVLAFVSMKTDGYESDKNDIIVMQGSAKLNLTKDWDGTVDDFKWSASGKKIYFTAAIDGTMQIFSLDYLPNSKIAPKVKQLTNGDFDIRGIIDEVENNLVVERTDMNHSTEIYTVDIKTGSLKQLTHVNDDFYKSISISKVSRKYFKATDGLPLLSWIIYPPNFDSTKNIQHCFIVKAVHSRH